MKVVKIAVILLLVYAGVVIAFESLLGFYQPEGQTTLVISTTADDGSANDRVLSRIDDGDRLYAAANHWPRAWYRQALANPNVLIDLGGGKAPYLAIPVSGEEHDRLYTEHAHGIGFRILTGFAPRYFVRLEPR